VDYGNLTISLQKIQAMTHEINNLKRQDQNSEKMIEIQLKIDSLPFDLRTIDREYIWEGRLYEGFKYNENSKYGYYILFNDLLILTKKKGRRFVVNFSIFIYIFLLKFWCYFFNKN
jgi:hypothetical protein